VGAQGIAEVQYRCGIAVLTSEAGHRNITGAIRYFRLSAENGIGPFPSADERWQTGREIPAAKYYRLSAGMKNAASQSSFGICVERGIGAHINLFLAAKFYRRAADQGHADDAINFAFCLEHGRGVQQNFEMGAEQYGIAAKRGNPEAKLNRARCIRLLG
jgi:TPR repeat protein